MKQCREINLAHSVVRHPQLAGDIARFFRDSLRMSFIERSFKIEQMDKHLGHRIEKAARFRRALFRHPLQIFLIVPIGVFEAPLIQCAIDGDQDLVQVERLDNVIIGPKAHALDGRARVVDRRDHEHHDFGISFFDVLKKLRSLLAGHPDIQKRNIETLRGKHCERGFGVAHGDTFIAGIFQSRFQNFLNINLIVYDQNLCFVLAHRVPGDHVSVSNAAAHTFISAFIPRKHAKYSKGLGAGCE